MSLDEDLSLGLGLSLESDLLCLSELGRLSLSCVFRLSEVSLEWLLSRELFLEFTGVFSAFISLTSVVIWYNLLFILSDFLAGFSVCSHFLTPCFFLGAVDSSISNCLVGDLALKEGDGGRRCLGPLLCFERDLLDDDGGVSSGGGGVSASLLMTLLIYLVNFHGGRILVSESLMTLTLLIPSFCVLCG